ncbi:MAG: hypothetical protein HFH68_03820 [Lachnospiraceae bacterium]|nr:hypothetical protein [Lachnospiraceae bacterium]
MTNNKLLLAISDMTDKKLDTRLKPIETDIKSMKEDTSNLKSNVSSLKADAPSIKLFQKNILLPRLNTIEFCYTDTYTRYKNYAGRLKLAFDDTGLLKKVVSGHSKKLEQLA